MPRLHDWQATTRTNAAGAKLWRCANEHCDGHLYGKERPPELLCPEKPVEPAAVELAALPCEYRSAVRLVGVPTCGGCRVEVGDCALWGRECTAAGVVLGRGGATDRRRTLSCIGCERGAGASPTA